MPRRAALIPATALIAIIMPQVAEAQPKSFCRRWAAEVATRIESETTPRNASTADARAADGGERKQAQIDALAGGGLGGTVMRMTKSAAWRKLYSQAYAHCRVVQPD